MKDSLFWRGIAVALVAGIVYVGDALHSGSGPALQFPSLTPHVQASVGVADENAETLFTASEDGRTIYMWQYYSSKPPKFIGQREAILSE